MVIEQPCRGDRGRMIAALCNVDMLRPGLRVRLFDQDLMLRQLEMPVRQLDGEPIEFAMPGQHRFQVGKAGKVSVVEGEAITQLREFAPLHRPDVQAIHGL
jgi:hypothetical protein